MKTYLLAITFGLTFTFGSAHAAGDPAAGQAKVAVCAACHGADGNSANPEWPKLAGQHQGYTVKQLKEFKAGKRENAMMAPMAMPLSEQDMSDIGAYYASVPRSGGFASETMVKLGEKIYRGGNAGSKIPACMACHGPSGAGDPLAGFPSLSGQHAKYIELQLNAFKDGIRNNDDKSMMRDVARWMSKEEIQAVSEYISGLH